MKPVDRVGMEIGSREWKAVIDEGAGCFGLRLQPAQIDQFARHAAELLHWNRRVNLTAITDPLEVAVKHFVDSIAPGNMIPPGAALLDIGSGGGFPGIPLKVLHPRLRLTLIDTVRKKTSFLSHIVRVLGLADTEVLHARVEEAARSPLPMQPFDVIVCRAFAALERIVRVALPLLAPGGVVLAWKGGGGAEELEAVTERSPLDLPGVVWAIKPYRLPFLNAERTLVSVRRAADPV